MNTFDEAFFLYINAFARQSENLDYLIRVISNNTLIKGAVPILAIWFLWYRRTPNQQNTRVRIVGLLFISVIAIALGRVLQLTMPHRLRPLHAEVDGFNIAHGLKLESLDGWSSMPSDHAVMFFSIAFCLFVIDRTIGIFAILHSIIFIATPRIFLGLHFPGDIFAGMIVAAITTLTLFPIAVRAVAKWNIVSIADSHPQIFYPAFFLLTLQVATMFNATREIVEGVAGLIKLAI